MIIGFQQHFVTRKIGTWLDQMDVLLVKFKMRTKKISFFGRQQDKGSVMASGGFGFKGQTFFFLICSKKMNPENSKNDFISLQDLLVGSCCVFKKISVHIHLSSSMYIISISWTGYHLIWT